MTNTRPARAAAAVVVTSLAVLVATGCGGPGDFENEPRPPVTLEITGVITEDSVTVSPDRFGAGPVVLTISNQTPDSHTVTLDGENIDPEEVGPINPMDTAAIQKTLPTGNYEVRADSNEGVVNEIEPADMTVGQPRGTGSDDLQLP